MLLKRVGRYLVRNPRFVQVFRYQATPDKLDILVDADWGGCQRTRRSTCGGAVLHGGHVLKSWLTTLTTICTSSGESEYMSMVRGSSIGLGLQSMIGELGAERGLTLHCDSSAALGISQRKGLGRMRHIDIALLWLQDHIEAEKIKARKISGDLNPADIFHQSSRESSAGGTPGKTLR